MVLIALGGNQIRMCGFQTANLFPEYRSTALSIISGAFSASAGVFLFVQVVNILFRETGLYAHKQI